jgi:RNA polymerase sigma-70 factor (ECF subfamily)
MTSNDTQGAFLDSLERHRGILFTIANAYCRDADARADLIQETIAQLWRAFARFDGRSAFSTWMYRIAVNVAISFYRRERRRTQPLTALEGAALESRAVSADAQTDERSTILREIIERFDSLNRALMILYLDDRPYSEIAEILGISETNVATKISRLKQQLKRTLSAQGQI